MRLTVFAFGKIRTPGLRDAANYYLTNLCSWVSVEEVELKPLAVPDKTISSRRIIQVKESLYLEKELGCPPPPFYLLDESGKSLSTEKWSKLIEQWEFDGKRQIALCVGSSLGFSDALREKAFGKLSLGPQTLSYELARVVLFEQLYRGWSILRRHPYHNEGK